MALTEQEIASLRQRRAAVLQELIEVHGQLLAVQERECDDPDDQDDDHVQFPVLITGGVLILSVRDCADHEMITGIRFPLALGNSEAVGMCETMRAWYA